MVTAIVLLNVERGQINETAKSLLEISGVTEVYSVTGDYDLVVTIRVPEYENLSTVVTERMQALTTITRTQTMVAFRCYSQADLQQTWDIGVE
jgi:DNA-binding Lrp family transcriptional regulator